MGTGTEAYLWRLLSASDHISPSIARIRSTAPSCQGIDVSASDSFQWALTFVGDPAKSYFFAISIHQIIGLEFPGGASLTNSPVFFRKPQDRLCFKEIASGFPCQLLLKFWSVVLLGGRMISFQYIEDQLDLQDLHRGTAEPAAGLYLFSMRLQPVNARTQAVQPKSINSSWSLRSNVYNSFKRDTLSSVIRYVEMERSVGFRRDASHGRGRAH